MTEIEFLKESLNLSVQNNELLLSDLRRLRQTLTKTNEFYDKDLIQFKVEAATYQRKIKCLEKKYEVVSLELEILKKYGVIKGCANESNGG